MQLLHLWILSALGVHSASCAIIPEARQWKRIHTNRGSVIALALGPEGTNFWVPHGDNTTRAPTTNTFCGDKSNLLELGNATK